MFFLLLCAWVQWVVLASWQPEESWHYYSGVCPPLSPIYKHCPFHTDHHGITLHFVQTGIKTFYACQLVFQSRCFVPVFLRGPTTKIRLPNCTCVQFQITKSVLFQLFCCSQISLHVTKQMCLQTERVSAQVFEVVWFYFCLLILPFHLDFDKWIFLSPVCIQVDSSLIAIWARVHLILFSFWSLSLLMDFNFSLSSGHF